MRHRHSLRDLLHRATHRIPGVPAHAEQPAGHSAGHQGQARHAQGWQHSLTHHRASRRAHHRSLHHGLNHSPARPPRVPASWQTRIARLFGQELG
ncbi:hypothetical protein AB0J37_16380 [Microbispora rosea]|uniref:hypothetical protein n=1 Tax=Microbispora rosea TaxID=58117 RepID=UPI00342F8434